MASEDQDALLAKIGQLAGQINRHKTGQGSTPQPQYAALNGNSYASNSHHSVGYSPYGAYNPRGGFPARPYSRGTRPVSLHRNRSLVLNSSASSVSNDKANPRTPHDITTNAPTSGAWVSKTDRHLTLINSAVYEKDTQKRMKAIEDTWKQKLKAKDDREKAKFSKHLRHNGYHSSGNLGPGRNTEIEIQGIFFRVTKNGSKLIKAPGDKNAPRVTPKTAVLGGVKFHRTKSGNMYRSAVVKAHSKHRPITKIDEPCKTFTTTGTCLKGPQCRYNHDVSKIAVCREFLQKGSCPSGDSCDLSHELTPERTPTCMHFSKGNCSNPSCRYMHVRVSPSALVCRSFGILGYCEKGASCTERHVHECPNFSNTGTCNTKGCKLIHKHKASVMRNNALRNTGPGEEEDSSDISSDEDGEDIGSDDVDSDDLDGEFLGDDDGSMDLDMSMQKDFVQL